ncbi:MAG: IPT/TIG domain-containing protein, partial [Myxococcota bacterium]
MGYESAEEFEYELPLAPAPILTGVTPSAGPSAGGQALNFVGQNLQPGGQVYVGANRANNVTRVGSTLVTALSPAGVNGRVGVSYVAPDGQFTSLPGSYEYLAAPALSTVNPNSGPLVGNATVVILGNNFASGTKVYFGAKQAQIISTSGNSQLTVLTPPGDDPSPVAVRIVNPDGQSSTLTSGYRYALPPFLTSVTPARGSTQGGTIIEIIGGNFEEGISLLVGGQVADTVTRLNPNRMFATVPARERGPASIEVRNPDGQNATLLQGFNYEQPADLGSPPVISSIEPLHGDPAGGSLVVIRGTGFNATTSVRFGYVYADVEMQISDQLFVLSPSGAGT